MIVKKSSLSWAYNQLNTTCSNLSQDNFKKTRSHDGPTPAPDTVMWYWSVDSPFWKCEISHWLPCGADGRSDGRTVGWLRKLPRWIGKNNFLPIGLHSRARVELHYYSPIFFTKLHHISRQPIACKTYPRFFIMFLGT